MEMKLNKLLLAYMYVILNTENVILNTVYPLRVRQP
jgi:hypothetical protein